VPVAMVEFLSPRNRFSQKQSGGNVQEIFLFFPKCRTFRRTGLLDLSIRNGQNRHHQIRQCYFDIDIDMVGYKIVNSQTNPRVSEGLIVGSSG